MYRENKTMAQVELEGVSYLEAESKISVRSDVRVANLQKLLRLAQIDRREAEEELAKITKH
jgi:hypothetical protein